jgi:arginase family enzyme
MFKLNIFSSCCKVGQNKGGAELSPVFLLSRIRDYISENELEIVVQNKFINNDDFINNDGYQELYKLNLSTVTNIMNLGGNRSITLSTISGSLQKYKEKLKVICIDSHINTDIYRQYSMDMIYIGLRSVEPHERGIIEKFGIRVYYMEDIIERGIQKIMEEIIKDDDSIYHLSFDINGLEKKYMPSLESEDKNGLSLDDGRYIIKKIAETGNLKVFDFVELNLMIGSLEEQAISMNNCEILLKEYIDSISEQNL